MTQTLEAHIRTFRDHFAGKVFTPTDKDYDKARSIWNGSIDRRPTLVARCFTPADVADALRFAQEQSLDISVRGGGHGFSGASVRSEALMIDLSQQNLITVDPEAKRVRCGGGATLAQMDAATQEHGLAAPGGTVSHTGIGGLTLGGGFGWLTRKAGLSCDNVVSADVVTADGAIVHASADEHPDLFWAIRGGGGNFGAVTNFEFRLHEVGPMIHMGLLFWSMDKAAEALRLIDQVTAALPADLAALCACLNAPPAPFVPERYHLVPGVAIILGGFGDAAEHTAVLDQAKAALPTTFEFRSQMPFTALQQMLDDTAPWGIRAYDKAHFLDGMSQPIIDVITDQVPRKTSPMSFVPMFALGGAYRDTPDDFSAFGGDRSAQFLLSITAVSPNEEGWTKDREWARGFWNDMAPYAGPSTYVNFMPEYDEERVRATYGDKYDRLARIKAQYDPDNVFRAAANIKPAK